VTGFQAAGIKNTFVAEDASKTFEEIIKRRDIGILITDKKVFDNLTERQKEKAMTMVRPTVVILSHDVGGEENLRLMIKRSLGIDLWDKE
jgi:vacuolar-type H+-ATPase subunit F/Vma7